MITRRRSRIMNTPDVQSEDVEVEDVVVEDLLIPSEEFPANQMEPAGTELDNLFEDLKWTLEKDGSSSLFDIDLADLCEYDVTSQNSGVEVSSASSPERTPSDLRMRSRQNQSNHIINKNAIAARMNRLKKKEYVNSLERQVGVISSENTVLKRENSQLTKRVEELEDETRGPAQTTTITRCPGSG